MSKQYGLILPNKHKHEHVVGNLVSKHSAFDEESASDDDVKKPINFNVNKLKRKDKVLQEKAIEEDPTVYQYDEIYEEIDQKKKESKLSRKDVEKKPKYMKVLMAAADRRKRENEKRIEKQVQKEREAEGDEFKDKESFVTTAYRKKLEEMKALEEQEQREEYLEAIGDVKRQGNLDGFYRYLYEQKVNYDDKKDEYKAEIKSEAAEEDEVPNKSSNEETKAVVKRKREYRKHNQSSDEDTETTVQEKKLEHLPSNLDADSDFSIDSSDSENEEEQPKTNIIEKDIKDENNENKSNENEDTTSNDKTDSIKEEKAKDISKLIEEKVEPVIKKPKIDIWKKRTVGDVFDAALQRYFERKSLRESG